MRANKGFTYRYNNGEALYPFGHDLSYTDFKYSNLHLNKTILTSNDKLTVTINVKNDRALDGEEVVKLYIKDVKSDKWMALKQLRKFERILIKKGEEKTIEFELNIAEDFYYFDATKKQYMVALGNFEIQVGASSESIRMTGIVTVVE